MTPEQELKLLTERLKVAGKGIILLHDPKAQTAAMLPAFLRYLRRQQLSRGPYRAGRPTREAGAERSALKPETAGGSTDH